MHGPADVIVFAVLRKSKALHFQTEMERTENIFKSQLAPKIVLLKEAFFLFPSEPFLAFVRPFILLLG